MTVFEEANEGKITKDIMLFFFLSIYIAISSTWIFKGDETLLNIGRIVRFIVPIILFVFFKKYALPIKGSVLVLLYGILVLDAVIMAVFSESPKLSLILSAKFFYLITFPLALLFILRPRNFSYNFLYVPVFCGLLFSLQSIILFLLIQSGNQPANQVITLVGYKDFNVLSYGVWGYAHGMMCKGSPLQVYRAQSFFGEPKEFAGFLEVSMLLAYGLYKVRNDKKMFLVSIICAVCFILTFSMSAYIAVFLTFVTYLLIVNWNRLRYLVFPALLVVIPLIILLITIYLFITTGDFYGSSKWGTAFGHARTEITCRIEFLINSLRLFRDYPFGIGYIPQESSSILDDYRRAGSGGYHAIFFWMGIGGIIGLVTQLTIILYLFKKIAIKKIRSPGTIERYISLAFIVTVLHHCVAGNWFTALFFYLVVCMIVTDAYQFSFRNGYQRHRISRE